MFLLDFVALVWNSRSLFVVSRLHHKLFASLPVCPLLLNCRATQRLCHFQIRSQLNFPDKRLLQWDCGKLQRLDQLLRRLKAGGHRVLLFTQVCLLTHTCSASHATHTQRTHADDEDARHSGELHEHVRLRLPAAGRRNKGRGTTTTHGGQLCLVLDCVRLSSTTVVLSAVRLIVFTRLNWL